MRLPSSRSSARALEQFSAASGHALTVSCSHRGQRAEGTKARVAAKTQEARNEAALPQETNAPTPSGRSSARATFGSKRATPRGSPLDARLHWQFPAATEGTKARVAAGNQAPSSDTGAVPAAAAAQRAPSARAGGASTACLYGASTPRGSRGGLCAQRKPKP